MNPIDELAAMNGATPDPIEAAEHLTALLDLPSVGLEVRGARIVGRGSRASCDVFLSDGSTMTFERMADVCKAPALAAELVACTGAMPKLKTADALNAARLIRLVAEHHESATADDIAFEWGASFLRDATTLDVDLGDQAQRWGAFARLKGRRLARVRPAPRLVRLRHQPRQGVEPGLHGVASGVRPTGARSAGGEPAAEPAAQAVAGNRPSAAGLLNGRNADVADPIRRRPASDLHRQDLRAHA